MRRWLAGLLWATALGLAGAPIAAGERVPRLCQADWLFVSDNPEAISTTRGLFYGDAGDATCIRLLYHHENVHPHLPLALQIWAYDSDTEPAQLEITTGAGGPAPDPMLVGHHAAVRFWQAALNDRKTALVIPPGQWRPLTITVLNPHDVVSGLSQIAIRSGRITIVVLANLPGIPAISPASFLKREGTHPFGIFASPLIEQHLEARMDQPRGLLVASTDFLKGRELGQTLKGNYGVIYHVRVECLNPSGRPVLLSLQLAALHGPAAGTLVVNGTLMDIPPIAVNAHREVARFRIPPGRWPLDIWASPEGASAYPVRLEFLPATSTENGD